MIHLKTQYKMWIKLIIDVYIVINLQFMEYIVTLIIVLHNNFKGHLSACKHKEESICKKSGYKNAVIITCNTLESCTHKRNN